MKNNLIQIFIRKIKIYSFHQVNHRKVGLWNYYNVMNDDRKKHWTTCSSKNKPSLK